MFYNDPVWVQNQNFGKETTFLKVFLIVLDLTNELINKFALNLKKNRSTLHIGHICIVVG